MVVSGPKPGSLGLCAKESPERWIPVSARSSIGAGQARAGLNLAQASLGRNSIR